MATLDEVEARKASAQEIWELTVPGRVHIEVLNHLGRPRNLTAAGKGTRLRISTFDRELAQERIRSAAQDPFRNGMLVRVDAEATSPQEMTDEDLREAFNSNEDEFSVVLAEMSEINVRRMRELAADPDVKATVGQQKTIEDQIADRFPIGGSVPSYDELMRNPLGGNSGSAS